MTDLRRGLILAVGVAVAAAFSVFALVVTHGEAVGAVLAGVVAGGIVAVGLLYLRKKARRNSAEGSHDGDGR